jgi:hypothetical protein
MAHIPNLPRQQHSLKQVVLLVVCALALSACIGSGERFTYVVHVQDTSSRQRISGAEVTIDIPGEFTISSLSDDNGFASFPIEAAYRDRTAQLIVEATGYQRYEQEITLNERAIPEVVRLEKL